MTDLPEKVSLNMTRRGALVPRLGQNVIFQNGVGGHLGSLGENYVITSTNVRFRILRTDFPEQVLLNIIRPIGALAPCLDQNLIFQNSVGGHFGFHMASHVS